MLRIPLAIKENNGGISPSEILHTCSACAIKLMKHKREKKDVDTNLVKELLVAYDDLDIFELAFQNELNHFVYDVALCN
ncbi:hypothetical protein ACHQM5_002761 [Ranunculus cassubicifolius]